MRTLAPSNHDVLPALLEPSRILEFNAQIYSQVQQGIFNKGPYLLVERTLSASLLLRMSSCVFFSVFRIGACVGACVVSVYRS